MSEPEQLTLFKEVPSYEIRLTGSIERVWKLGHCESMEEARSALRVVAAHTAQTEPVDWDNHISTEGRMYGMRGSERITLDIVVSPAYSYPQEST